MNQFPNLKILAFAAHPDDVELAASGTLMKHINMGHACGIIDLTRGELGTRGSAELRDQEAASSAKIMGLTVRDNLNQIGTQTTAVPPRSFHALAFCLAFPKLFVITRR